MKGLMGVVRGVVLVVGCLITQVCNSYADSGYYACPDGYEREAVRLVNILRESHNLRPFRVHPALEKSSSMRAYAVTVTEKLNHKGWKESIVQVGYGNYAVGENLARGYNTPSEVVKGWYFSQGHRENILDRDFNYIGIGCFVDQNGSLWWSQHFGGGA